MTGPVVTKEYVTRREATRLAKIADGTTIWHRMGDVGYLDDQQRFWFCGARAHCVQTAAGTLFTEPCEGIFGTHPAVYRAALVGVGKPKAQTPVIIDELGPSIAASTASNCSPNSRRSACANPITAGITHFRLRRSMPVDIRHNAKIFREKLAVWAAKRIAP